MAALFIAYPDELFYKSQFGLIAFLINSRLSWSFNIFHASASPLTRLQINQIIPENSVLLLHQQVKVYVFSAVRWEQDFFSLTSHEESKLFSGFSTFQTFQESLVRRESLSLLATLKSTSVSVCFQGISR